MKETKTPNLKKDNYNNDSPPFATAEEGDETMTLSPPSSSPSSLTKTERKDIFFLVLAFSCVVCSMTLSVGMGAVVVQSVGGSTQLAPFALAVFFMGMSFVSLTMTHWIFQQRGRKIGFWVGTGLGLVGSATACGGCLQSSPALILVANALLGAGTGMGLYLRFAAVEVVPTNYASRAVTWTLCGGCIAAFAGPEAAQAATGVFGDPESEPHLTYLGIFLVAGGFYAAQALFVSLINFPLPSSPTNRVPDETEECSKMESADEDDKEQTDEALDQQEGGVTTEPKEEVEERTVQTLWPLLMQSNFLLPLMVGTLAWAIMAMPMSIFRVVMKELGFTDRQSLTVIEFHFLSMYAPGFWSGTFIQKYGLIRSIQVSIAFFVIGLGVNLAAQDNNNSTAVWYIGLICLGMGWNFGFSSATVWTTDCSSKAAPQYKAKIQAANEFGMFLMSGGCIFSTGYLYNAATGDGGVPGWRILNFTMLSLTGLLAVACALGARLVTKKKTTTTSKGPTPK